MHIVRSRTHRCIGTFPISLTVLLACLISTLPDRSHSAIYIDDFTTPQVISGLNLAGAGCVSGPEILGTERDAEAYAPSIDINSTVPGQFWAYNAHPENWGLIVLTYDGVDQNTSFSNLGGLGHVDLTQGGLNDRIRINVTAASNLGGSLSLSLRNIGGVGSAISVPLPGQPGVLDLKFADFNEIPWPASRLVNFADVGFVQLTLSLFPGESYVFGPIIAVPEPSPEAILLFTGAAALSGGSRRNWRLRWPAGLKERSTAHPSCAGRS